MADGAAAAPVGLRPVGPRPALPVRWSTRRAAGVPGRGSWASVRRRGRPGDQDRPRQRRRLLETTSAATTPATTTSATPGAGTLAPGPRELPPEPTAPHWPNAALAVSKSASRWILYGRPKGP